MAEERIDIVITERGSRVVQRNLEDIGRSGREAAGGVDFLKRALAGLGAYLSVRELVRLVDTYTNLQNRLRATGLEAQNLGAVYRSLLDVSNSTRQSLEGTVETYSRLANSAKDLGLSQQELIDFTKSLNQAIALSGASAGEAQAGMIQLAQGLASGVLRGDELNSVLEQLPTVADVIAKELKVTRGELRQMGQDGKISADIIFDAFKNARTELEERFGKAVPTVGQAFQVLKNNITDAVGELDKTMGVSTAVSSGILGLANNIGGLVSAITNLTKVILVFSAAYAAATLSLKASAIVSAIGDWYRFQSAVAAGTVVVLGSAEAERQKAAALLASSVAGAGAAAQSLAAARSEQALAATKLASVQATAAQLVAERQLEVARLRAQVTDIGRMRSLSRLAEIRKAEAAITAVVAREQATLATAQAATAAAEQARASALTRVAAAQTGLAASTAAAAGTTTIFGRAVLWVRAGLASLWAVVVANPITALIVAIVAAVAALTLFRDQINLGVDDITTLGDLMRALGETVGAVFGEIWQWAKDTFGPLIQLIQDWVGEVDVSLIGILRLVAKAVDTYIGAWRGAINAVIALFKGLPAALGDLMTQALNVVLGKIGNFVNAAGELLSTVTEFAGLGKIAAVDLQLTNENEGAARQLGQDIGAAFSEGFRNTTYAQDFLERTVTRAQEIARERKRTEKPKDGTNTDPPMGPEAAQKLKDELAGVVGRYDQLWAAQEEVRRSTEILNNGVAAGMITRERANQVIALMNQQLRDQLDPLGAVNGELDDQQRLLGLSADAREIESQMMSIENDLRGQGVNLNATELRQLRERLTLIQAETQAAEARNRVMEAVLGPQKEFALELQALNDLMKAGTITQEQANAYLVQSQQDLFAGTAAAQDALVSKYQQTFDQINQLRQADLISETQANQMRQQQATQMARDLMNLQMQMAQTRLEMGSGTWADSALVSLGRVQEGFTTFEAGATQAMGNFFTSFTDGFANSVGRAIVYSEDLNEALGNVAREAVAGLISALVKLGIQWLVNAALGQSIAAASQATAVGLSAATGTAIAAAYAPAAAMASLASFGANAAPAMAGITATTALSESLALASMAGFKEGGYTGEGGVNQVMGVVHGKEFVVNAQATAANRPLLEAMNRGAVAGGAAGGGATGGGATGGGVSINIENYGTSKDFEVQRLGENEIRIIARDEARNAVRAEAPAVISAEISNPNSSVSKSLGRSTMTQRRR